MIRCYKYWAQPASRADADLLFNTVRLAGDYRHVLVDIENKARGEQRALWSEPIRAASPWQRRAYFLLKAKSSARHPLATAAARDIAARVKAWTSSDEYKAHREQILLAQRAAGRAARGVASGLGLHYGTYWLVEDSLSTAVRTTAWSDDLGHRPARRVGAPISANAKPATDQLGESHTKFQLHTDLYALGELVDGYRPRVEGAAFARNGTQKRQAMRRARIRVGTTPDRQPLWADLHVLMHRPLPAGLVSSVWVQYDIVGGRTQRPRWEIVITVDVAEGAIPAASRAPAERMIAIDIGWRRRLDGTRIAYWLDDRGEHGEWVIPLEVENRQGKSSDLRSIRDQWQNRIKETLRDWQQANPGTWLEEELRYLANWHRIRHFDKLERLWRDRRVVGDAGVYNLLVEYLRKNRHLHAWEGCNLDKMQRQIRGRIDTWAHELCRTHAVITIESFSLSSLKEKRDQVGAISARSIQRFAPGEIRMALKRFAVKFGCEIVEVPAANTTRSCSSCGHLRDAGAQLVITCGACGVAEDQDLTACKNLMRASKEVRAKVAEDAPKKKLGGRRNRRRADPDRSQAAT